MKNRNEREKLRMELNTIDIDHDFRVDKHTIYKFLAKKGIDLDHI